MQIVVFEDRYKSFEPRYKSFIPIFKSFVPRYKWFEAKHIWFEDRYKWFVPRSKYLKISNMNIDKAYRSAQLCDNRTTWTSMNTFSRTTRCLWNTNAPVHTKIKLPGFFFKISHDPGQNFRARAFVKNIYTRNGSYMGLMGIILIAHSMGTIGKYKCISTRK